MKLSTHSSGGAKPAKISTPAGKPTNLVPSSQGGGVGAGSQATKGNPPRGFQGAVIKGKV